MRNSCNHKISYKIFVATAIVCIVVALCALSMFFANTHHSSPIVNFEGVGVNCAQLDEFLTSDEVKCADKNARYNFAVQLVGQSVAEFMSTVDFQGDIAEFVETEYAKNVAANIQNTQDQVERQLASSVATATVSSKLQLSQNCVFVNMRLADLWKLEDMPQVKNVVFEKKYYAESFDNDDCFDKCCNNIALSSFDTKAISLNGQNISDKNNIFANNATYSGKSYKGEGSLVAVIDNGFEVGHSAFAGQPTSMKYDMKKNAAEFNAALAKTNAYKAQSTSYDYFRYSDKIPFKFNYALNNNSSGAYGGSSHGTHVAGIVAGNDGNADGFRGVACDAQLMLCRVSDNSGGMSDQSIALAMDDCLAFDVDVVNISLGSNAGLDEEPNNPVYKSMNTLNNSGIAVVVAAGNEGTSGGGADGNGKASSANPDNGIIGSPSSYSPSLAVANFDGKIGNQCIADTSSRGVSNTMLLKPDIAGIGTNVNSSGVGGKYGTMSGTSMASPNVAGALIAIEQYCMQTPQIAALLPAEQKKAAKNMAIKLIMSTAEILKQTNSTQPLIDGIAYSPRAQGAGIANLDRAIKSKAYIQTNNVDNRPKIDGQAMAKSDGIYQFEFDIVNMSTTPLQYNVEVETITEFISNKLMSGLDRKLSPTLQISTNGGSTFDALLPATVVNVAAEATQKVVVKISLTPGDKTILSECPNGMFVEGFVKLKQVVGSESNLSMPFVAYYGQWTTAGDVLDATYYDVKNGVKNAVVRPTTLYAHYQNDNVPIGDYLYTLKSTEKVVASASKASISKSINAINSLSILKLGLLRSCEIIFAQLVDTVTGTVVPGVNYYSDANSKTTWVKASTPYLSGGEIGLGSVNAGALEEGREYKLKVSAYINFIDNNLASYGKPDGYFENSITVDSEAPTISNVVCASSATSSIVEFDLADNRFAQMIAVCKGVQNGAVVDLMPYDMIPIDEAVAATSKHCKFDIAQYDRSNLYFYTVDYAMNKRAYQLQKDTSGNIVLVEANIGTFVYENLAFSKEFIHLNIGENYNLAYSEMLQNVSGRNLTWASSDTSICSVDANGRAKGIADGVATITAKVSGSGEQASIVVNVGSASPTNPDIPSSKKTPAEIVKEKIVELNKKFATLSVADKPAIAEARKLFDALSAAEKKDLAFYEKQLVNIEAEIARIEAGGNGVKPPKDKTKLWIGLGIGGGAVLVIVLVGAMFALRKRVD